jgi:2-desacetyl-2-hydroxyethyl bacteriochlorophyllide A dehydrogenase
MRARALLHVAKRHVETAEIALPQPGRGEVAIAAVCSAVSSGTEAMIYAGAFPPGAALDTGIASLQGAAFAYPFAYGYALAGRVVECGAEVDASWQDALVFVFHPHQDRIVVPVSACQRVPPGVSAEAALYLPQVETAVTLVMDAAPVLGERAVVFGLGVVGLLTARLLCDFPLSRLVAVEPLAWRREQARQWGIAETLDCSDSVQCAERLLGLEADVALELSGDMAALNLAIEATGFEGRIVVGSWYGTRTAAVDLGSRFHRNRLRLVSSQVSTLAPAMTGRWDKARRMALAWRTLERMRPERLPARFFPLAQCQEAFETLCARPEGVMQFGFRY